MSVPQHLLWHACSSRSGGFIPLMSPCRKEKVEFSGELPECRASLSSISKEARATRWKSFHPNLVSLSSVFGKLVCRLAQPRRRGLS